MPTIFLYLLKCSISLAIVWLFYQLLLRRLTFYTTNRWYLVGYVVLSFLLPLIHIVFPAEEQMTGNLQVIRYIPAITAKPSAEAAREAVYTGWDLVLAVVALGALALLVRLLIRYLSLRRIQKGALLIGDTHLIIYHVNERIIPFSFGRAIYINPRLHSEKECEEIILHEYVHVRQRHTVDILVAELLCILCWFNPFSWLIRHSIRQNLEFIADRQVLDSGLDRKAYQYHLLKVVGESRYRLANNFNFSSLKKRIIMMNKSRSGKFHLVKFLFIVPLLGTLLVAFRDRVDIKLPHFSKMGMTSVRAVDVAPGKAMDVDTTIRPAKDTSKGPVAIIKQVKVKDTSKPMFIIDEVEASQDGMRKLSPSDISFINVMKDDLAVAKFGSRARDGVVLIYTKAYAPVRKNEILLKDGTRVKLAVSDPPPPTKEGPAPSSGMGPVKTDSTHIEDVSIAEYQALKTARDVADTSAFKSLRESLLIVDGKPCSYEEVKKIDPNSIESISILRNKSAEAIYGPKAKNGVVLFVLKKETRMKTDTVHVGPAGGR
ncbi:MAG TPA: M56 family metallopeptidase [Puia sp.]|nr:M56 family metallopeptidase [Puia sp.]